MTAVALVMAALALAPPESDTRLLADPSATHAARQAAEYREAGRKRAARLMRALSEVPQAWWFTGGRRRAVRSAVRAVVRAGGRRNRVPVLVAYNAPNRDCSQYSAGGARSGRVYRAWINAFARGIGRRRAIVILEPDALAAFCGRGRLRHIRAAVDRLARLRRAALYVDAGHSNWQDADTMARRLRRAHLGRADGFALNVANFRATREIVAYGTRISNALGDAHFVIDTSRNGRGPWRAARGREEWCNPPGRGLGARPTTQTGHPLIDALLWIKIPGESDGPCADGTAPPAGAWWPSYALGLARRADPRLRW